MCKVIRYCFSCSHSRDVRQSRCSGTYHKVTRHSIKAACTAEYYICIYLKFACGICQQLQWTENWTQKLERAKLFYVKYLESGKHGAEQILTLVQELETKYATEANDWNMRNVFPQGHKPYIPRVAVGRKNLPQSPSPLAQEVKPENVVFPEKKPIIYDDPLPNTDPLHPITTDYSHPLDHVDTGWIDEFLSSEELATHGAADTGFDPSGDSWSWGEEAFGGTTTEETSDFAWSKSDNWGNTKTPQKDEGSNTLTLPLPPDMTVGMATCSLEDDKSELQKQEQINKAIQAFWATVNDHENSDHESDHSAMTACSPATELTPTLTDHDNNNLKEDPYTTSLAQNTWTDGSSDYPLLPILSNIPTTANIVPNLAPTNGIPLRHRSYHEKLRRDLRSQLAKNEIDYPNYCRKWLLVAREEIKTVEGPEGRYVAVSR